LKKYNRFRLAWKGVNFRFGAFFFGLIDGYNCLFSVIVERQWLVCSALASDQSRKEIKQKCIELCFSRIIYKNIPRIKCKSGVNKIIVVFLY
jgi:hypothetical protein